MVTISRKLFGLTSAQEEVYAYEIKNGNGVAVTVLNFGGIIQSLKVPTKNGSIVDVTPGFDHVKDYEINPAYFGAIIGRVANRIYNGSYEINGKQYEAFLNKKGASLHGGLQGFDKKIWSSTVTESGLELSYLSQSGEESYPGNLNVTVLYSLDDDNVLTVDMQATTDEPTIVNLTNHAYFNLSSHAEPTVYDHMLYVNASHFLPKTESALPTGEIVKVDGTPFDFRQLTNLGDALKLVEEDTVIGIDHNLCFDDTIIDNSSAFKTALRMEHPTSGIVLEMETNQPGVQIYTGNYLDGFKGKDGVSYGQHSSVALEPQMWPDAVHHSNFPSIRLNPGERYHHLTRIKFSVRH